MWTASHLHQSDLSRFDFPSVNLVEHTIVLSRPQQATPLINGSGNPFLYIQTEGEQTYWIQDRFSGMAAGCIIHKMEIDFLRRRDGPNLVGVLFSFITTFQKECKFYRSTQIEQLGHYSWFVSKGAGPSVLLKLSLANRSLKNPNNKWWRRRGIISSK